VRRIELLPRAIRDLEAIPPVQQERVLSKVEMLREFPEMGPPMFDAFDGYRSLLAAKHYRVVYRIRSNGTVEIAWIRDTRRRPLRRKPRVR